MKKGLLGAVVVLALLAGTGSFVLRRGYSARETPSALEAAVARRLRRLATPPGARDKANPLPLTAEVMADARAHFADHCAVCHANDGSGDTAIGRGLYPKAPDMRKDDTQRLTDGELFYIIRNGVRFTGMPGWGSGPEHEDRDSWAIVHLIRHLPRITPEELAEMKRLNPKGPHELEEEREEEAFLGGREPPASPPPEGRSGGHRHKH